MSQFETHSTNAAGFGRRQVLGGSALVAASAMLAGRAHASADMGDFEVARAALVPEQDPALSYVVVSAFEFFPSNLLSGRITNNFGVYGGNGSQTFAAPVNVPAGSKVIDVTVSGRVKSSPSQFVTGYVADTVGSGLANIGAVAPWVASNDIQTHTFAVNRSVGHARQHVIRQRVFGNSDHQIGAAMVSYIPPAEFVPIAPSRAYDSRLDMSPDANGLLASSTNRTISIADRRDPVTGAPTAVDAVPPGARAVSYNLTVAAVSSGGFLSIEPGGTAEFGASTLNWDTNTNGALANGGIVGVDDDRKIKVFCGGGPTASTHFIVDVTGYFR